MLFQVCSLISSYFIVLFAIMMFMTFVISILGTKYPTANLYFPRIFCIHHKLCELVNSDDVILRNMATPMLKKFSKYWSSYSTILAIAVILDPRYKMKFVEFAYNKLYGYDSTELITIKSELYSLFDFYMSGCVTSSSTSSKEKCSFSRLYWRDR